MKNSITGFIFITILLTQVTSCNNDSLKVSSPDEKIILEFSIEDGTPFYSISREGGTIIDLSSLGFGISGASQTPSFKLLSEESNSVDTQWEQPWGEYRYIQDRHNELKVHLEVDDGRKYLMELQFRVFNDGVGFRYSFPEQDGLDSVIITGEMTQFSFPEEHDVWWIPVHSENSYYESLYRKNRISETDTINTPATFETADGRYLAIHEANLTDFASMTLRQTGATQYESELVPWSNGVKVYAKTPFVSPWRTIIIADEPGGLMTSTLMLNLNEPCKLEDISWIKPSKYIGIWWGMHLEKYTWGQGPRHGATTERVMKYIDFASENGFDGVLAEGWNYGWDGEWWIDGTKFSFTRSYPDFDLEKIASYAAGKNVELIGHHETGGAVANYERQMVDAYELYQQNGVHAVKTGYVNKYLDGREWHDGQFGVRHYRKVIETAAKYQIMIDNHEPVKGTGLQRTYPNLMTQEGGRGQEYNAWSPDGGNPPSHTTILPFTRMLAGPFDFTPGVFDFNYKVANGARTNTTLAKQLALYVTLFSPQQMACDLPENYSNNPAFDFIKAVPCNWSDTKVLNAEIGKYITIARKDRNSEEWYVGSITNEESRILEIELSFLENNQEYRAEIYADGSDADYRHNPESIHISARVIHSNEKMKLTLAPGGGAAIRLVPLPK